MGYNRPAMTVSVQQAGSSLIELIAKSARGEKVIITQDHEPVAELVAVKRPGAGVQFGLAKGVLTVVGDDEAHLEDFKDYMP